jgi:amino acid adenylation domain-containing protein/non-ribosomal peptide synthase protein (TIGR01720 family)
VSGDREKRWALFEQKLRERGLATAAIAKAPRAGSPLGASFAQERLLFLEQLTPGSAAYNDHYAIRVTGRLDPARLGRVLDEIATRHETLRTSFAFGPSGDALQVIHDEPRLPLRHHVWSEREQSFEAWVVAEAVAEAQTPFDLMTGPLARARLLTRHDQEHVLLFTIHHAVWDGWSSGVLAHELSALYAAQAAGATSPLPRLDTQYADYALWQRQRLSGAPLEQKLAFWKGQLAGAPFAIDLPTDRARPRLQTFAGKTLYVDLGEELSAKLEARSRELGGTPFAVLFASFAVLLARYGGQRDLVIATPIANRARVELEGLIGCFVNTLAVRVDLDVEPTLRSLVRQVSERVQQAEPHQDLPFEKLIEALGVERDLSRSPIAQVMFVLQNTPPRQLEVAGLKFMPLDIDAGFAKLDLTLNVRLTSDGYAAAWEYNTDLFDEATIRRMMGHFEHLLQRLLDEPDVAALQVDLLLADERRLVLGEWNQTSAVYPHDATLHSLFARQARKSPDAVALVVVTRRFSYAELAARARVVALALEQRGVGPGDLVAVFLRRDEQLIFALLGVLMSGAAYVPLDPAYPQERVGLILEDTEAAVILSSRELGALLPAELESRVLDVARLDPSAAPPVREVELGRPSDRAYIIYTSGSTGKPKGVAIEHQSAVAFVAWAHGVFSHDQLRGVLAATSVCFDLSVFEIFGTLLAGGSVILAENILSLAELPARAEVTLVNTVPSAAIELLRAGSLPQSVRTVNLAGEPLLEDTVLQLYALPHVERVYNLYGPSETTTYSTYTLTTPKSWKPTIGRPISNTRAYVLDEHQKLVPLGVRGELFLGGIGVARGYLHRPELTAQRFLPDPFSDAPGARMYKTGDVVRWLASGELEYLGRNDHQVKLRGFRIELGEIESALRRQTSVADAVVTIREDRPGTKTLVAYVVPALGGSVQDAGLRTRLGDLLPEYMVPARFVTLEALPLSPNGKVDRKRLPPPPERDEAAVHLAPRNAVEATLAGIWQEVLQLEAVGVRDSFFELGGDSIAAMRMSALARRAGLELSVSQIFQSPTLETLAERAGRAARASEATPLPSEPFPLSPIQRWFFERRLAHPNHYNQSVLVELRPDVSIDDLRTAIGWTLQRHSALRLHFLENEQGQVQRFGPQPRVELRTVEVRTAHTRSAEIERVSSALEGSLNFVHGPLGQIALFDAGPAAPAAMFFVLHHLVVDVVSWHVLLSDIAAGYRQIQSGVVEAPAAFEASHYAEYVAQLARSAALLSSMAAAEQWSRCDTNLPRLPRDFDDGENLTASQEVVQWTLDAERTAAIAARAREAYRVGIEDVVLSALCLALRSNIGSDRVVLDIEKHGRDLAATTLDLTDSVGWFTRLFPLVFEAASGSRAALIAVKDFLHGAPDRGSSFQLLRYGGDTRVRSHLAQMASREVVYNFLGNLGETVADDRGPFGKIHAGSAASDHHPENVRSHLLEITALLKDGALELRVTFSRNVHSRVTVARLVECFAGELETLEAHLHGEGACAFTVADFPLARLSQAELDAQHAAWWGNVEDVYATTPAQHAILVDVLRDPEAGYYVPQLHAIVGRLDGEVLAKSLTWVMQRHSALRTALAWNGLDEPVQVVFSRPPCPITHDDFRSEDETTRRKRLDDFLAHDQKRGFALDHAPLLRLLHARWTDGEDLLVWTIHHAVSDGWSLPIIIGEVLAAYSAFAEGTQPSLPPARPFRDYVGWFAQQNQAAGEAYFHEQLRGASELDLGIPEDPSYRNVTESTLELDAATGRALEQLAKRHSVTLGVVLQAAWAVVLARHSACSDVVFGSVDSGRPTELDQVEQMVGMFVTTLPLRVTVDDAKPLGDLLVDVQNRAIGIREHAYVALARLASATASSRLFQSICVLENYPSLTEGVAGRLGLKEVGSVETTRFPLTVTASTRGVIKLTVSASLADDSAGPELLAGWRHTLEQMASGLVRSVGEIDEPHAARRRSARSYWNMELEGAPTTLLPTDRPRASGPAQELAQATLETSIPPQLSLALAAYARPLSVPQSVVLLGVLVVLTSRYAAQSEVVVAVELEPGEHVPIRADVGGEATFRALVQHLDLQIRNGRTHFDAFTLQSFKHRALVAFSLLEASDDAPLGSSSELELTLAIRATPAGVVALWTYNPRLFEEATVARMSRHFLDLADAVSRVEQRISDIPFGDSVGPVGDASAAPAGATTLLELFRASAAAAPGAIAVMAGTSQLTYAELDAASGRAAARLRASGVGCGDLVAVHVERSPLLVVVLLAVLKAGAAYVALDAETPVERARFMLEDSQAKLLVVGAHGSWQGLDIPCVAAGDLVIEGVDGLVHAVGSNDLAYVIYTSGSTGAPKGVMVEHVSLLSYLSFYGQATNIGANDRLLQFASPSFDVSVEEIFGSLCFGATLVLRPENITPSALLGVCDALGLSILSLPTAYWNELTRALAAGAQLPSSVRLVVIGGERASRDVLAQWRRLVGAHAGAPDREARVRLLNMYGPTEATISATCADLTLDTGSESEPPIGRPVAGAIALVVDESGNQVPVGVPGELLLGGRCLARGYLNRPELTAEKFTPSALVAGRLYHTGDLVRWRADEQLEYLGRIDQQVKIRGFRVELGEIESTLRRAPGVENVLVVLRDEDTQNPRIVAYVVGAVTSEELRGSLAALPPQMIPAAFVLLDRLPVTSSGKIDRRALPLPGAHGGQAPHVLPRTALEATLSDIWQRVLQLDRLSIEHSFFELGGHSLLAMQVVSRIQAELGVEVTVRDLFEAPTVERLAVALRGRGASTGPSGLQRRNQQLAPLSFAQARVWFLDQLEPGNAAYNMPFALRVSGKIDPGSLGRALSELSLRHSVLRSVFGVDQHGQPLQRVDVQASPTLDVGSVPVGVDAEAWAREQLRLDAARPFDLTRGPLLRARLLSLGSDAHVLTFNVHHIVSDGWSLGVLVRELGALYRAFVSGGASPLPELPIQYADYASWQRAQLSGPELERQLRFWKTELEAAEFRLDLPRRPGARGHSYAGATVYAVLDFELAKRIDELALALGATPFMVLLAAWALLLSRFSGQAELVIGTPVANRRHVETEGLIGLFVNTLAIRADLREQPSFAGLVTQLRERLLRAQAHEELPFERLVDALHVERDLERSPIFQVMFAMQNAPEIALELPGLTLSPLLSSSNVAKFDITLNAERTAQGYATSWEYRSDFFEAAFIERLSRAFTGLLQTFVDAPNQPCSHAPLVSGEERTVLLRTWNDTARDYPAARVCELIEAQAKSTPAAVAVKDENEELTYRELDERAHRLALHLLRRGAKHETRIAVALDRSVRLVVALLAVQKAGAAYVPLDPALPRNRMREILEDARVELVLTETAPLARLPVSASVSLLCLDQLELEQAPTAELLPPSDPDTLAYVLFTSGSTGRPKGVEITHRALVNFLWSMRNEPGISPSDIVLAATNLSFDIAGLELYLPLVSGASVFVATRQVATSAELLAEAIRTRRVTFFQATPSTYKMLLLADFEGSKTLKLLVGGEPLPVDLAERLLSRCESLWNVYGPTETTVWSTCAEITSDELARGVTIGRPIANTQAYVLDGRLEPVPLGARGELYLGGHGLARGYASRPDLTAERFLPNPFGPGRIYRTGDVVRHLEDGTLECFGRVDHQVKVRGFRIELGEIEAALRRYPGVADVAVDVQQAGADDKRIVAYVVSSDPFASDSLRHFLRESLPEYMVPAHFEAIVRLPTTPNGKLDRKALPRPQLGASIATAAPRDEIERKIAAIFSELLHVPHVGAFGHFFDLGGHSLLATELVFRLRHELGVELPVRTLFEGPTVAALAASVRGAVTSSRLPKNVVLARRGSGVPWFCFPALAGTAAPYLPSVVADMGPSVFLLEAPGLDGAAPLTSVEAMSSVFADAIRSVEPARPLRLLGWSFGALTALVTALALEAEGRRIEELVLVDPAVPGMSLGAGDETELAIAFIVDVAESAGKLSALTALGTAARERVRKHKPADLFQVAKDLAIFASSTSQADFEKLFSVYTASASALRDFVPDTQAHTYTGKASILAASAGNGPPPAAWLELLPRAEIMVFDASHYTILEHLRNLLG